MIARNVQAGWKGDLKGGIGNVRAGQLGSIYSFASRREDGAGATPGALIGSAELANS